MPWGPLLSPSVAETFPNLSHLISQTNSVALSPAPSIESQNGGSPKHMSALAAAAKAAAASSSSGVDSLVHSNVTSIRQLYPGPTHSEAGGLAVPPPLGSIGNGRRSHSASSSHSGTEYFYSTYSIFQNVDYVNIFTTNIRVFGQVVCFLKSKQIFFKTKIFKNLNIDPLFSSRL
jgi:hypothetical protein